MARQWAKCQQVREKKNEGRRGHGDGWEKNMKERKEKVQKKEKRE